MAEKACSKCRRTQPLSEFARDRSRKGGLHPHCRSCRRAYGTPYARRRRQNPELRRKEIEARTRWGKRNPDKLREYRKRRPPNESRASFLKSTYGITETQYDELLTAQNGVCAICGLPERRRNKFRGVCRLHVDHDHQTGKVRGLLCATCNFGLGSFKDDTRLLARAADYLNKHYGSMSQADKALKGEQTYGRCNC